MQIFSTIRQLIYPFKGILLDAYGVFWGGNSFGLLPDAKETMRWLVEQGKIVGILTNSSHLATNEKAKLEKHGLIQGVHFHFLITSGEIAKKSFSENTFPIEVKNHRYFLLGSSHPQFSTHLTLFEGTLFEETDRPDCADFIYLSIPHIQGVDQTDPALFYEEVKKLAHAKLPLVCVNPDRFAHEGNPPKPVVRQGSIAAFYEKLGGKVVYLGKPSSLAFETAMKQFHTYRLINPPEILMIGDTLETDIRGARDFGMASALITKTGIFSEKIKEMGFEKAISLIPPMDYPEFFIERLI